MHHLLVLPVPSEKNFTCFSQPNWLITCIIPTICGFSAAKPDANFNCHVDLVSDHVHVGYSSALTASVVTAVNAMTCSSLVYTGDNSVDAGCIAGLV